MLKRLYISNYVLIDNLDLDLSSGLSIITGETGAGKSIILGALSLLMGDRADLKVVGANGSKAVVEGEFQADTPEIRALFEENQWDWFDEGIVVRREISLNGKSRGFVNDTPANLKAMKALSSLLIDIHSQHQTLLLSEPAFQLSIIDAFSDNSSLKADYGRAFKNYIALRQRLNSLKSDSQNVAQAKELLDFQLAQLNSLRPKRGEQPELEKEFDLLSEAEELKEVFSQSYSLLDSSDESVLSRLSNVIGHLSQVDMSLFEDELDSPLTERLRICSIELKDISQTLCSLTNSIECNPARLQKVEERLNSLFQARKHYKVKSTDELVDLHEELAARRSDLENFSDESIRKVELQLRSAGEELKHAADLLSASREEGSGKFVSLLLNLARPLGLPNLQMEVKVNRGKFTATGQDHIEFFASFNKNTQLLPMSKVASGGEASRLMLSVKSLMATKMHLPTVIFDEVDTGVSGEIADCMGSMMREMSAGMQVIAITHLPQVASQGDSHFHVKKIDESDRNVTKIHKLSEAERVEEIARMLSGSKIGEEAIRNAKALLNRSFD